MLALFSFGSAKLGTMMRLAVIGAVAFGIVRFGGSVWANPPDGNGNHQHGGGDDGDADIIAPDAVTNLSASSAAMGTIRLGWTAVGDDGCTGSATAYDIRYSTNPILNDADFEAATQAVGEPRPQSCGALEQFCLAGLTAGATYDVAMKVIDDAGNVSGSSNVATAAAGSAFGEAMHVDSLVASWTIEGPRKRKALAIVRIHDEFGTPVEGATVTGDFSGCTTENNFSGVTDCTGRAFIPGNRKVSCTSNNNCCFVFTVTNVEHDLLMYLPEANAINCSSIQCYVSGFECPACE